MQNEINKNSTLTALRLFCWRAALWVFYCLPISSVIAQSELDTLSLEQLMSVEVVSASAKVQTLGEVAAAVFVISAEDIRRSGVTSVAEALRMVPGIHVGRIDDTRWAVSARGFNDQLSNKLMVMMDGRYLYTPDFVGVFWSDHMPLIDNVERIEVTRGPGATVWGSNAVNGVINIISRSARDTQGLFLQARGGNRDMAGMAARYGGVTKKGWFYRFDFNSVKENITDSPLDLANKDYLENQRVSFRLDGTPAANQKLTFEGSAYYGESQEVVQVPRVVTGQPVLSIENWDIYSRGEWLSANWELQEDENSSWNLRGYLESKTRDSSLGEFNQTTLNLRLQRRRQFGKSHDVIWGLGTRLNSLPFEERTPFLSEIRDNDRYNLYEFFIQDEISITDKFAVTLGSKFEKSEFAGLEIQPTIRFSWQPINNTTLWASVSRAARTPSNIERNLQIQIGLVVPAFTGANVTPLPITVNFNGSEDYDSEYLTAYEAGIKGAWGSFEFDLSLFDFHYTDLLGGSEEAVNCQPSGINVFLDPSCFLQSSYLETDVSISNESSGHSRGVELAINWSPQSNWNLSTSLSFFDYELSQGQASPSSDNFNASASQQNNDHEPEFIFYARSEWTISSNLELDLTLRSVGESSLFDIDSYTTADLRLEWKPRDHLRFEVIGQNLLDRGHTEYGSRMLDALPSRINSGIIARITWAP